MGKSDFVEYMNENFKTERPSATENILVIA